MNHNVEGGTVQMQDREMTAIKIHGISRDLKR